MIESVIVGVGLKLTALDTLIVRNKCKGDTVYVVISSDGRTNEEVELVARQVKVILMTGFMQAGMDVSNFRMMYKPATRSVISAMMDKMSDA